MLRRTCYQPSSWLACCDQHATCAYIVYSAESSACLQVLPFAGEETLQQLEANLASMPSVTELLHQGLAPKDITEKLLAGIGVSEGATSMHPRYCHKTGFQCFRVHLLRHMRVVFNRIGHGCTLAVHLWSMHKAISRAQ